MRVVVVDDSIVRGNTSRAIARLLRQAGAAEVHFRVSSPPIRHPCFMGIDFPTYEELTANRVTLEELAERLGVDSLGYLSVEGMQAATRRAGFCLACFTGEYPVPVQLGLEKAVFESGLLAEEASGGRLGEPFPSRQAEEADAEWAAGGHLGGDSLPPPRVEGAAPEGAREAPVPEAAR